MSAMSETFSNGGRKGVGTRVGRRATMK
ncbi:MAG: hypothetical protein QOE27_1524, partial [Solirubrobacteraceae bacterium]|nr:hypothetical protein [Solirubrobacteraceae bacterium]